MVDTKISGFAALSGANAATNDELLIVDVSANQTKNITLSELLAGLKLFGITLDDLSDVAITGPVANNFVYYNGSSWVNSPINATAVVVDSTLILNSAAPDLQQTLIDLDTAIRSSAGTGIPATIVTTAGDLILATGNSTVARLAKGSDEMVLATRGGTVGWVRPQNVARNVDTQSGTTYTLTSFLNLEGSITAFSNASSITVTVPTDASDTSILIGHSFDLLQAGVGQVTVVGAGGVTVNTASSLKLRAQYSAATLVKTAANTWYLVGDLEPLGQSINAQTGTTYTFVIGDASKLVTASNAAAQTYTVPTNASVAFPIGTHIDLAQIGVGQVTIAAAGGVTVNATPTLKTRAQYSGLTLVKTATDTWIVMGDLAAA